ncbi:MAG: RidA family protein [Eubacteriales bacterium]|nr:RidA family protein [Eubacteriales bacterium]MDD3867670.1 RidA family protein [Eubacteriales bacterium]MDD4462387.1 RidA family protein [Eubacteriales bacterium]
MNINQLLDQKAAELNINYMDYKGRALVGVRRVGNLLFTSGSGCAEFRQGRVGENLTFEDGYLACQHIATIQLMMIREEIGDLDRIDQFHRAFGLISCDDDFHDLDKVFDGFSDVLHTVFGERGKHTRTVMGTRHLPVGNTAAEIELILSIKE